MNAGVAKTRVSPSADGDVRHVLNPGSATLQKMLAVAVILLPLTGVIVATIMLWYQGINIVEIVSLAAMYVIIMLAVTVGFHRYFAHRSFSTQPAIQVLFGVLGSMAAQGPLVFWVSTHRRHHAFSDQPGDPHSPNLHGTGIQGMMRGLWHAHIGWMFSEAQVSDWVTFARDILQNRTLFKIHKQYFLWVLTGLAIPPLVGGLITHSSMAAFQAFLWGGPVRMFLVNNATWCLGSICHYFGNSPFETRDHSANNFWVALFTFGDGNQNNHHAFPGSYKHGLQWWEPDVTARVIRLLEIAGLVWQLKTPSKSAILNCKKART